ncbi:hypothetical protein EVAR_58484_1 [Eumeta japonica]|uniref:Uncharacterized protein n=1 Tax=Eumeta variegata TaxID=151549 RepID=A0A4C1YNS1_EUMVA|nr:hypothetical protein EVAR_58484_1 [Eumeta japonica]
MCRAPADEMPAGDARRTETNAVRMETADLHKPGEDGVRGKYEHMSLKRHRFRGGVSRWKMGEKKFARRD